MNCMCRISWRYSMEFRRLFIFVEGDDDKKFINEILTPLFEKLNFQVSTHTYARETKKYIKKGKIKSRTGKKI